jgi:UDP-2,3-diacylglucosamine pyrophosphatase LpxH
LKLDTEERRLFVISDLHIGSPASSAGSRLEGFLDHVRRERWALCINGDGFDILQSNLRRFVTDVPPVLRALRRLIEDGLSLYYTVGNHDIVLEHVLEDLPITVTPFLNLRSGDVRIRVEHGHLYEPFYAKHPHLYEFGGRAGRPLLLLNRDAYRFWSRAQLTLDRRRRRLVDGRSLYPHHVAAQTLVQRGFDAVIFGHTHLPELTQLADGGTFVNSGSWMKSADVVRIEHGDITLGTWSGRSFAPA